MTTGTRNMTTFDVTRLPKYKELFGRASDIAFLAGSRQAGFANLRSDDDLYVIYSEGLERLSRGSYQFVLADNTRVDVACFSRDHITAIGERINLLRLSEPDGFRGLPLDDVGLYFRVAIGEPVVNPAGLLNLQQQFFVEQGAMAFGGWSRARAALSLAQAFDYLKRGQETAACLAARAALIHAVNAFTAANGNGYPSEKQAFVKLESQFGRASESFQRPWRLKAPGDIPLKQYLDSVAAYCADLDIFPEPRQPLTRLRLSRSPTVRRFTISGADYLVHHKLHIYSLNPQGRFVWDLFDGSLEIKEVAAFAAEAFGAGDVLADIEVFARELLAAGLVEKFESREGADMNVKRDTRPLLAWTPPEARRLKRSAAEFAVAGLLSTRALAQLRAAVEDMVGGLESNRPGLVATTCGIMLTRGIQAYAARECGRLPQPVEQVSSLFELGEKHSSVAKQAWELAQENPILDEEVRDYAARALAFVENTLAVDPFAGWWRSGWDTELDRRHWDAWGPLVLLTSYLGIDTAGVTIDAALKDAQAMNSDRSWMDD